MTKDMQSTTETVRDSAGSLALLRDGERLDDLLLGGMKIIQRTDAFRFGTDSVLLADFAAPRKSDVVADLGTGTGVLCLLMAGHVAGPRFDAVEIQTDMADMAKRSVRLCGLEDRIAVHPMDLRDAPVVLGHGRHTLVVCNPPYSPDGTAVASERDAKRIARHAGTPIEEICLAVGKLLKNGGRAAFVYPAPRMLELMQALSRVNLQPKRVRLIQDRPSATPKLFLLDAVKGAGSMLHWLPPLILKDEHGGWTDERNRIYRLDAHP